MLRHPFSGHRRYSITHRAVQRLRELVPARGAQDDESLRDELDHALGNAEDDGKAIRTVDAMLGEPQTLVPVPDFGEVLYAIIKEDTVVTVLPRGHGEEILQRGEAVQRGATGTPLARERAEDDRRRTGWRPRESTPVVVERIVRGSAPGGGIVSRIESVGAMSPERERQTATTDIAGARTAAATVVPIAAPGAPPEGPVAEALARALTAARRRAAVAALRETLELQHRESTLQSV